MLCCITLKVIGKKETRCQRRLKSKDMGACRVGRNPKTGGPARPTGFAARPGPPNFRPGPARPTAKILKTQGPAHGPMGETKFSGLNWDGCWKSFDGPEFFGSAHGPMGRAVQLWVHVCLMYVASHSGKCEMSNNISGPRTLLQHGLQITNAPQKTGGYGEETRWLQAYMSLQAVQCNLDVFWWNVWICHKMRCGLWPKLT